MSREIQLSTNSPAAADFWTQGGNNAIVQQSPMGPMPPAQAAAPRSPMKKAHRLLRGRYPLAIFLAAAGAAAGAVGGYMSVPPKFESTGSVLINPLVETGDKLPGVLNNSNQFVQVELSLLSSPSVVDAALSRDEFKSAWKAAYGSRPLPTQTEFISDIDVAKAKGDGMIHASFDDRNKDVALAGCKALFHSYMQLHGKIDDVIPQQETLRHDKKVRDDLESEIAALQAQERQLGAKFGTEDLGPRDQYLQEQRDRLDDELRATTLAYNTAVAASKSDKKPAPVDMENIYFQIARLPDRMMQDLINGRRTADRNMEDTAVHYGPNHPAFKDAERYQREAHQAVDDYAKKFLATNPQLLPQFNDSSEANIASLKERVETLQQQFNQAKEAANEIDKQRSDLAVVKTKIASTQERLDAINKTIDSINTMRELSAFVTLYEDGSEPVIDDKKRKLAAGVGLMFGGLIPIGLLMLYGLTENRFRYSDDANADDLSGVTLLGILPNLPDRLSDPQQAGVAAHCVHQIRTMLQISRSNDEPQVIAVTSAAPGDGKTSLTLALGLSYAACGARTLLVDCDLIAAGLTHRLNVSSPDGVLEAVANRALLEYVRTTDIADVAILPVGTTHAHHASTLSPVALRRLLSEAKKQFDIIIVDTGPILGSIEASLVCAASDRTILTVARNQQRPLVERSIGHLQSIGSNLAGVVFNRAQARDFEKSMNGLALRSRPPAPSGATAKAVAGSFKRAG